MSVRGRDPELRLIVARGHYQVDSRKVAEAIVRSGVLKAGKALDRPIGTGQDEAKAA